MARVTREIGQAWVNEAIMVLDGKAPSRHFWSRWMDRALAPHAAEMIDRPGPIPANDVLPEVPDLDKPAPARNGSDAGRVLALRAD